MICSGQEGIFAGFLIAYLLPIVSHIINDTIPLS